MSQSADKPKRERVPMNGVDTPTLFATINAVREQPGLGKFQFRATNRWLEGTHSEGKIESFSGDINGCLADNVERVSKYGPGKRLNIRTVEAGARVRAKTLSGDIDICDR